MKVAAAEQWQQFTQQVSLQRSCIACQPQTETANDRCYTAAPCAASVRYPAIEDELDLGMTEIEVFGDRLFEDRDRFFPCNNNWSVIGGRILDKTRPPQLRGDNFGYEASTSDAEVPLTDGWLSVELTVASSV